MDWFDNWPKSSPRCRSRLFGFGLFWKVWQNFWPWRLASIFCFLQTLPFLCVGCGKLYWNASGPLYRSWSDRLVEYILPCSGIEITPEYKVAKFLGETDEAMGTLCLLQTTRFFSVFNLQFFENNFCVNINQKKKEKQGTQITLLLDITTSGHDIQRELFQQIMENFISIRVWLENEVKSLQHMPRRTTFERVHKHHAYDEYVYSMPHPYATLVP